MAGPIEGQFFIDPEGKLMVIKRDYRTAQVGKTKEKTDEEGRITRGGDPIMEAVPAGEAYAAPTGLNPQQENRVRAMMTIRDNARALLLAERTGESDTDVENQRARLRAMHTEFVRRYGNLNRPDNAKLFQQDPDSSFLQSLETQKGGKWYGTDIFSERQLWGTQRATAKSASDAMVTVLDEVGKLDFERMGQLLGKSAEEVRTELAEEGFVYHDPVNKTWETSDVYLAGSIQGKIQAAREAAEGDSSYAKNVEELEKYRPETLKAYDISINLGAAWIPQRMITDWYSEVVDVDGDGEMRYDFDPVIGQWVKTSMPTRHGETTIGWGLPDTNPPVPAWRIFDAVMANRPIEVKVKSRTANHARTTRPVAARKHRPSGCGIVSRDGWSITQSVPPKLRKSTMKR